MRLGSWTQSLCMDVAVSRSGAGDLLGVGVKHAAVFLLVAGVGYVAWKQGTRTMSAFYPDVGVGG